MHNVNRFFKNTFQVWVQTALGCASKVETAYSSSKLFPLVCMLCGKAARVGLEALNSESICTDCSGPSRAQKHHIY